MTQQGSTSNTTSEGQPGRRVARLLFLYDAESGKLAAAADSFKKLLGKGCPLCAVTHGVLGPRPSFIHLEEQLSIPLELVHKNELEEFDITAATPLPCILAEVAGSGERIVLLDPAAVGRLKGSPRDLQGRLEFHAAAHGIALPFADLR